VITSASAISRLVLPWARRRRTSTSYYTERVLERSPVLAKLAATAGSHPGRLDGSGYHRGASAPQLGTGARVLAAADAYDAKRPGDPLAGHVSGHALPVPARRQLAERVDHFVAHVQASGEQPRAIAEVSCRELELLLASDQLLGDQPGPLGQRPVVREATQEVLDVLDRLRGWPEDLDAALEVDLVTANPLREVGRRRGTADVRQQAT
jgi:hypothetical protein